MPSDAGAPNWGWRPNPVSTYAGSMAAQARGAAPSYWDPARGRYVTTGTPAYSGTSYMTNAPAAPPSAAAPLAPPSPPNAIVMGEGQDTGLGFTSPEERIGGLISSRARAISGISNPYAMNGAPYQAWRNQADRAYRSGERALTRSLAARGQLGSGLEGARRGALAGNFAGTLADLEGRRTESESQFEMNRQGQLWALDQARIAAEEGDMNRAYQYAALAQQYQQFSTQFEYQRVRDAKADENAMWDRWAGLASAGLQAGGTIGGAYLGGPPGAIAGGTGGRVLGNAIFSRTT